MQRLDDSTKRLGANLDAAVVWVSNTSNVQATSRESRKSARKAGQGSAAFLF